MRLTILLTSFVLSAFAFSAGAKSLTPEFSTGIIGTSFVANAGSSLHEYKVLIDFKVHGRHRVELKFVERNNYEERDLSKREKEETVMVNCTRRTYTTSIWLASNDNNYGFKQYQNGDAISWDDESDDAYANYDHQLPLYLKMVCNSL